MNEGNAFDPGLASLRDSVLRHDVNQPNSSVFKAVTAEALSRMTQRIQQKAGSMANNFPHTCVNSLNAEDTARLERLYPDAAIVYKPLIYDKHSLFSASTRLANDYCSHSASAYSADVVHIGGHALNYITSGRVDAHLERPPYDHHVIHEAYGMDVALMAISADPVSMTVGNANSRLTELCKMYGRGEILAECPNPGTCMHRSDAIVVDGSRYAYSPLQVACTMLQHQSTMAFGFIPISDQMLYRDEGDFLHTGVRYSIRRGSNGGEQAIEFIYPEGRCGVLEYPWTSWASWFTGHTFTVGKKHFQLELSGYRDFLCFYRMVAVPELPPIGSILAHNFPTECFAGKLMVRSYEVPRDAVLGASRSLLRPVKFLADADMVTSVFTEMTAISSEAFTKHSVYKKLKQRNDRVVAFGGAQVRVGRALSVSEIHSLALAVYQKAFLHRWKMNTLSKELKSNLGVYSNYSRLSRATRVALASSYFIADLYGEAQSQFFSLLRKGLNFVTFRYLFKDKSEQDYVTVEWSHLPDYVHFSEVVRHSRRFAIFEVSLVIPAYSEYEPGSIVASAIRHGVAKYEPHFSAAYAGGSGNESDSEDSSSSSSSDTDSQPGADEYSDAFDEFPGSGRFGSDGPAAEGSFTRSDPVRGSEADSRRERDARVEAEMRSWDYRDAELARAAALADDPADRLRVLVAGGQVDDRLGVFDERDHLREHPPGAFPFPVPAVPTVFIPGPRDVEPSIAEPLVPQVPVEASLTYSVTEQPVVRAPVAGAPPTDLVDGFVKAVRIRNDMDQPDEYRHEFMAQVVVADNDPDAREPDYVVDDNPAETLSVLSREALPAFGFIDATQDEAQLSTEPQDFSMHTPRTVFPVVGDPVRPRKAYRSRVQGPRQLRNRNTQRLGLIYGMNRNMNTAMLSIPQDVVSRVPILVDEFFAEYGVRTAEDPELWRTKIREYQNDRLSLSVEALKAWAAKVPAEKLRAIIHILEEGDVSLGDLELDKYSFDTKRDEKPDTSGKSEGKVLPGQSIVAHARELIALTSPVLQEIYKRFETLLDARISLNLRKNSAQLAQHFQGLHEWGKKTWWFESDYSAYDKSQLYFVRAMEEHVYDLLGLNMDFSIRWFEGHVTKDVRSFTTGLGLWINGQRSSGDVSTSGGNGITTTIATLLALIPLKVKAAAIQGDDILAEVTRAPYEQSGEAVRTFLAQTFNLMSKSISLQPYMTSCYLQFDDIARRVTFIPDPLKRAVKLSMYIDATGDPAFYERWISFKQLMEPYRYQSNTYYLTQAVAERHPGVSEPTVRAACHALATLTEDFGKFRDLWDRDPTFI